MKTVIFDYSEQGKSAYRLPADPHTDILISDIEEAGLLRAEKPRLAEVSEVELIRHYTKLSTLNYGVDSGYYPLGSCTMKYNPKINQDVAALEGFSAVHPLQDEEDIQGILQLLYELEQYLCGVFGFAAFGLQPAAGAQGEYAGLLIMKAYHADQGNAHKNIILIPDSAHGTNPASVIAVGWKIRTVASTADGRVDLADLKSKLSDDVAGIMLTNPNTLGLFENEIAQIAEAVHGVGGLLYWDGANANAVMGYFKPAEAGFDIAHLNLHKTFSTPHGGGGPGAGPVGVVSKLVQYLPAPRVEVQEGVYKLMTNYPKSVGRLHSFYGNAGILVRAYTYIRSLGAPGLKEATENSVLLANYMKSKLADHYQIVSQGVCKHEFVISLKQEKKQYGIRALDVAKRLMDYGFYPPTIYFPLIVSEALMIETPETEPVEAIDAFVEAMIQIKHDMIHEPQLLLNAPHVTPVSRFDEVKAVREPRLSYFR